MAAPRWVSEPYREVIMRKVIIIKMMAVTVFAFVAALFVCQYTHFSVILNRISRDGTPLLSQAGLYLRDYGWFGYALPAINLLVSCSILLFRKDRIVAAECVTWIILIVSLIWILVCLYVWRGAEIPVWL